MAKVQKHTIKSDCKLVLRFLKEVKLYASWRWQGDAKMRSRPSKFQDGGLPAFWKAMKNGENHVNIKRMIDVTLTWRDTCEGGTVWSCADIVLDWSLSFDEGRDIKRMVKYFNDSLAESERNSILVFSGERLMRERAFKKIISS